MLTNAILHKKKQPDGPKNGMMINKTVNQCDPFSIAFGFLLWPFSILDWSHTFNTSGFNPHSQIFVQSELPLISYSSSSGFLRRRCLNGREELEPLDG